jgi:uncharacterized protein YndB with AHSA1/START domain
LEESINLSAWLGCNIAQAFDMFTDKAHLQSWLPMVANVDPRPGGKYELSLVKKSNGKNKTTKKTRQKNKKKKTTIKCKILSFEPNKYIAFEWKSPGDKQIMDVSSLDTQVAIYFLPINISKKKKEVFTEVHLILTGWNGLDNGNDTKEWFEHTWTKAFEKLIEYVNDIKEDTIEENN